MNRSHLDKLSESYAQIAEGKKSEEEVKDWNRKDDNPEGKKVDKKKVDKCTCESFYLKRLHAMNPVYAEQYRAIAEVLIGEGYESSRLLDNIIEVLPMDVVGPEFVSAMKAVNPRIHENLETAEKKLARAIVFEQRATGFFPLDVIRGTWNNWRNRNNKPNNNTTPTRPQVPASEAEKFFGTNAYGAGGSQRNTGSGRDGSFGSGTSGSGMPSNPPGRLPAPSNRNTKTTKTGTGLANIDPGEGSYNNPDYGKPGWYTTPSDTGSTSSTSSTSSTGSAYTPPRSTGPITSAQAIARGSTEGQGPKSPASTWVDPKANATQRKTHIGRHLTLKQHQDAVAKRQQTVSSSYQPEGELVDESGYFPTPESQRKDYEKHKPNLSTGELPGRHKPVKRNPDGSLQKNSFEPEGEQINEGIPLALGAGAIAGGLALWKAYQGAKTVEKIKNDANSGKGQFGAIKKATDARSKLYQQNNSFEPEGEQLQEKPGDGWIGPTVGGYGIPNPIRVLAHDPSDIQARRLKRDSARYNQELGRNATSVIGGQTYNRKTSDAYNKLFGKPKPELAQDSFAPEGEMVSEGEKAGLGGNRGPAQGGSSARDRGGETTTIQKKIDAQRDAENARGDRGREFTKPAQLNQLKRTQPTNMRNSYEPEGDLVSEMDIRKINPGAALGRAIERALVPPVADGTLKGKPKKLDKKMNESTKSVFESLKQARKNVGASTCWDGYKAKGTKTKNGKEVPNCVKEGIRDEDAEKGTKERKERLEKKRGHKVDDHPQFKKDKKDDSYLETNMKKRHENNEKARKEMADKKDDTVPRWMKDDFNLYDIVLTYLDENEIMESVEHAEEIMEQLTAEEILGIVEEVLGEDDSKAYAKDAHGNTYRDYSNDGLSPRQRRMRDFGQKRIQQANQQTADTQAARSRAARSSKGSGRGSRGGGGFSSLDTATYGLSQFDPARHGGV